VKLRGDYEIDLPEVYLRTLADRAPGGLDGDRLVSLALERALVHAAARRTLEDFVDFDDAEKEDVRRAAQGLLDLAGSGIALSSVATPEDPTPALAIKKEFGALQDARVNSDLLITSARQEAHNVLVSVAGERYPEIVQHIEEYERAIGAGDEAAAGDRLDRIREMLSSAEAAGEITTILEQARSYRAQIEATLGNEARRFAGLLPAYRAHPELVRSRLLADKRSEILGRADTEVVVVPAGTGALRIALTGIEQVKVDRRKKGLELAEALRMQGQYSPDPYYRRQEEMFEGRAGRTFTPEGRPITGGQ
jgi:regulator of protease activity HflC (stomatin/prohibitin superfamily)